MWGDTMRQIQIGNVSTIFISQKGSSTRNEEPSVQLDKKGICNDKFYNKDIERSVLITSKESYILAQKNNIQIPYGSLGENLLIDYNPYHLPTGTRLAIGTSILQISQNCTLCDHLSSLDPLLPKLLKHDRGIFATVVQEGEIKKNDKILIIEEEIS